MGIRVQHNYGGGLAGASFGAGRNRGRQRRRKYALDLERDQRRLMERRQTLFMDRALRAGLGGGVRGQVEGHWESTAPEEGTAEYGDYLRQQKAWQRKQRMGKAEGPSPYAPKWVPDDPDAGKAEAEEAKRRDAWIAGRIGKPKGASPDVVWELDELEELWDSFHGEDEAPTEEPEGPPAVAPATVDAGALRRQADSQERIDRANGVYAKATEERLDKIADSIEKVAHPRAERIWDPEKKQAILDRLYEMQAEARAERLEPIPEEETPEDRAAAEDREAEKARRAEEDDRKRKEYEVKTRNDAYKHNLDQVKAQAAAIESGRMTATAAKKAFPYIDPTDFTDGASPLKPDADATPEDRRRVRKKEAERIIRERPPSELPGMWKWDMLNPKFRRWLQSGGDGMSTVEEMEWEAYSPDIKATLLRRFADDPATAVADTRSAEVAPTPEPAPAPTPTPAGGFTGKAPATFGATGKARIDNRPGGRTLTGYTDSGISGGLGRPTYAPDAERQAWQRGLLQQSAQRQPQQKAATPTKISTPEELASWSAKAKKGDTAILSDGRLVRKD